MLTTRCFLLGDETPFLTILCPPIPGCSRWSEKQRLLAGHFDCDADDVGSNETEDGVETIEVRGKVVGTFAHPMCRR